MWLEIRRPWLDRKPDWLPDREPRPACRGPKPIEELGGPDRTYPDPPGTWRPMPATDSPDPARARWIDLLLNNPAGARRERLHSVRRYWKQRLLALEQRLAEAERELREALSPPAADDPGQPPIPPAEAWRLRCACAVAWADVSAARARLAEIERELERR